MRLKEEFLAKAIVDNHIKIDAISLNNLFLLIVKHKVDTGFTENFNIAMLEKANGKSKYSLEDAGGALEELGIIQQKTGTIEGDCREDIVKIDTKSSLIKCDSSKLPGKHKRFV